MTSLDNERLSKDDYSPVSSRKHMSDDVKPSHDNQTGNQGTNNKETKAEPSGMDAMTSPNSHMTQAGSTLTEDMKYPVDTGYPPHLHMHNFNHPFSINNLMSGQEVAMMESKMYGHMHGYSPYGQLPQPQLHHVANMPTNNRVSDADGQIDGHYYRSYTPSSTANLWLTTTVSDCVDHSS